MVPMPSVTSQVWKGKVLQKSQVSQCKGTSNSHAPGCAEVSGKTDMSSHFLSPSDSN